MPENGNISGKRLKTDIKRWICETPFLKGLLSNPFLIGILILTVIWLLDVVYGKTFEEASVRETIQHATTVWIVMVSGIFLNNLTISKCEDTKIEGGETNLMNQQVGSGSQPFVPNRAAPTTAPLNNDITSGTNHESKYNELLSLYE